MGRSLYILAATLGVLALVSFVLSFTHAHTAGDVSLWRTSSIALFCLAMMMALFGILSSLFEQAERRADQQRAEKRQRRFDKS